MDTWGTGLYFQSARLVCNPAPPPSHTAGVRPLKLRPEPGEWCPNRDVSSAWGGSLECWRHRTPDGASMYFVQGAFNLQLALTFSRARRRYTRQLGITSRNHGNPHTFLQLLGKLQNGVYVHPDLKLQPSHGQTFLRHVLIKKQTHYYIKGDSLTFDKTHFDIVSFLRNLPHFYGVLRKVP